MLAHLRLIRPDEACPQGFLPQQRMLNEALKGLPTIDILPTTQASEQALQGHLNGRALQHKRHIVERFPSYRQATDIDLFFSTSSSGVFDVNRSFKR
jgi:hypothetical protein